MIQSAFVQVGLSPGTCHCPGARVASQFHLALHTVGPATQTTQDWAGLKETTFLAAV